MDREADAHRRRLSRLPCAASKKPAYQETMPKSKAPKGPKLVPIRTLEPGQSGWLPADPNYPEVPTRKLTLKYCSGSRARVVGEDAREVVIDGEVKARVKQEFDVGPETMVQLEAPEAPDVPAEAA